MFCRKCGKENADDAVYCQKCGVMLEAEEETRVAGRDYQPPRQSDLGARHSDLGSDKEKGSGTSVGVATGSDTIFSISPTLMFVKIGYVLAAIGALMLVAALTVFAFIPGWATVLLGLALFLIPAFYHFRQKLIRYNLTEATIEIDTGLMSRNTRNIPLRTIQDVTVSATMWQRMLGVGDILIDNASEDGGKVVLKGINSPRHYADMLLRQMRLLDK
ncbi:MAG: PH domain-containing protein [Pyrinomonadaceae bacterium]